MRRSGLLWVLAVLAGLAASAARLWEFRDAYDDATQLHEPWHPATLTVLGITALAFVLLLGLGLSGGRAMLRARRGGAADIVVQALACLALLGSAGFDLLTALEDNSIFLYIFVALTLGAAGCLLRYGSGFADGRTDKTRGFFLTVPVFWSCYWMIQNFWDHAANPVLLSYFYGMLCIILTTFALHAASSLSFGADRAVRLRVCAFGGLLLGLLTLLPALLSGMALELTFPAAVLSPASACRYAFVLLQMSLFGLRAANARPEPTAAPEASEGSEEPDEFELP
jgi:hypothetical protein